MPTFGWSPSPPPSLSWSWPSLDRKRRGFGLFAAGSLLALAILTASRTFFVRADLIAEEQSLSFSRQQFNDSNSTLPPPSLQKCSRQSIVNVRALLIHEFSKLNARNFLWFADLTREELAEDQKTSLTNLVNLGQLDDEAPTFEVEASYFRPLDISSFKHASNHSIKQLEALVQDSAATITFKGKLGTSLKLNRKHADKCIYNQQDDTFGYTFGVTVYPIEHHLDLVFNYPRELRRSQPTTWTYASAVISVPRLNFEVSLEQNASYSLNSPKCPLEIVDVTYIPLPNKDNPITTNLVNIALTNETKTDTERLFNDYTWPAVTDILNNLLKFHLTSKSLPFSV